MTVPLLRNAVVTGASSGIGRELVRQLVRDRNMNVLATARRRDRLEALAGEFPEGRVAIIDGDLAEAAFRALLWDRAEAHFPDGIDLLVNNAGLGHYGPFEEQSAASIDRIFAVNVIALCDLTSRAIVHMKARGHGQIVEVSSVLGFLGIPDAAVYVAAKHAVNGLVKSLRYELRDTGVRVWAACPGPTDSEFSQVAVAASGPMEGKMPHRVPTDRVVRAIIRELDGRRAFLMPSGDARWIVRLAHWLPAPFDAFMARWGPGHFRKEHEELRKRVGKSS
jgi:short-subunit dehydrogenase